ncbi:MAG: diaminopimelate epimerase [Paracoccaceae bacterium]|nr:diaminopimelate epimerase [Paracoccaceae bacterium]
MTYGDMNGDLKGGLRFRKMHGLGNDFVIIDARGADDPMSPALARAIGDRRRGVGFDQLAIMLDDDEADAGIVFWNADGSTAGACGNASRCLGWILMEETGRDNAVIRTERGMLGCRRIGDLVEVNMGEPQLRWLDIPLAVKMETKTLALPDGPAAVGMGNPHCVFFVADAEATKVEKQGPLFEVHPLFPERTNVEFAQVIDRQTIRLRVWERGAGETLACGSGACATAVAAHRRGLTDAKVMIRLNGGDLTVDWREDGVYMTGPTTLVHEGMFSADFLTTAAMS